MGWDGMGWIGGERHYGVDSFMGCAGLHGLLFFNTFAGFLKTHL